MEEEGKGGGRRQDVEEGVEERGNRWGWGGEGKGV